MQPGKFEALNSIPGPTHPQKLKKQKILQATEIHSKPGIKGGGKDNLKPLPAQGGACPKCLGLTFSGASHLPESPDVIKGFEGTLEAEAEPGEEGLHDSSTLPSCGERGRGPPRKPQSGETWIATNSSCET
jgi:hypothetical protein